MAKYFKKSIIIVICLVLVGLIITPIFATPKQPFFYKFNADSNNFSYVNDMLLESSRYTQYKPLSQAQEDLYEDHKLNYSEDELELMGFEKVLTHSNGSELWFEDASFSIILIDQHGYMWSSRAEWQDTLNSTAIVRRRMLSGLSIQYVNSASVKSGTVTSSPILDVTQAVFKNFTEADPENDIYSDKIRPYIIDRNQSTRVSVASSVSGQTLTTKIHYKFDQTDRPINIQFDVLMSLTEDGLTVKVPQESIVENHVNLRLLSINIFSYFGSTLHNNQPGYIVIPEGVGALARFDRLSNETMSAQYDSTDFGFTNNRQAANLSLPFYGIVHKEGGHAMYAHLKQGAQNTTFQARLFEANNFNSAFNSYQVRTIFNRPIDRSGRTIESILETPYPTNYEVEYRFLADHDASYVGIATDYRDQLVEDNVFTLNEQSTDIPVLLNYIMSDKENAFIGTKTIHMTSIEDITNTYNYFKDQGILNQQTILSGWSNDGFVSRAPYRISSIESHKAFDKLSDMIKTDGNHILLDNDYVSTTSLAPRVNNDRHTMKSLARIRYEYDLSDTRDKAFLIKPEVSLSMAQSDAKHIDKLGVSGLYSASLGHILFSSYEDKELLSQIDALAMYTELLSLYDVHYMNRPNAYMFEYIDGYTNLATTNKQFTLYTDLVPILPIVLKGSIPYYGGYLNFNAIGQQRLLQMIDYGISPSYILTKEDTFKMRFTRASQYYSTTLSDYEDEIIDTYTLLNDALKHTMGGKFVSREVIASGVVKNTYLNQGQTIIIYINYTQNDMTVDGISLMKESYEVMI